MTDAEWLEYMRALSDDELESIALHDHLDRNRHDAQDEQARRECERDQCPA